MLYTVTAVTVVYIWSDFHPEQGLMKINYEHAAFTDPSLLCQGVHIVDLHSALQSTRETTCVCITRRKLISTGGSSL